MTNDIIDFEAAKDLRTRDTIDDDQARWEEVQDRMVRMMCQSELSDIALTSATLNALLEVLLLNISLPDAKRYIVRSLSAFEERTAP